MRRRAVAGGARSIAAGNATTGGVTHTLVLYEFVNAASTTPRYAVLGEELFQLTVLFGERILVSCDAAEILLQS